MSGSDLDFSSEIIVNKNILLVGHFDASYIFFLKKKYNDHNIHYWSQLEQKNIIEGAVYYKFDNFNDASIVNFLENFKIDYDLVLVQSLNYWDNIRIIRNIPKNLSKNAIIVINNVIHIKEFYMSEISLYGHDSLYDSIEFVKKSKLLFSDLSPFINNLFSSNDPSHLILLRKK
jgi:hypothetical protein